jgi:hypothetical protein
VEYHVVVTVANTAIITKAKHADVCIMVIITGEQVKSTDKTVDDQSYNIFRLTLKV